MTTIIQPFDLQTLFVNTLSGNLEVFSILSIIVIMVMCARFKMSNMNAGAVLLLYGIIMAQWIPMITLITTVGAAFIIYTIVGRIVKT